MPALHFGQGREREGEGQNEEGMKALDHDGDARDKCLFWQMSITSRGDVPV